MTVEIARVANLLAEGKAGKLRCFCPAVGGDHAVLHVHADSKLFAVLLPIFWVKREILHGNRAQNHALCAQLQRVLDSRLVADAAADLYLQRQLAKRANRVAVFGAAVLGTVQIHYVQLAAPAYKKPLAVSTGSSEYTVIRS